MLGRQNILRVVSAVLTVLLCGCGASTSVVDTAAATPTAASYSLDEMLAQIESTPMPGVAPDVADGLRKSLSRALLASGQARFTSSVAVSGVDDLSITNNGDGTATAHWTYRNTGDLDQNSEVNVSDLSALGANLGKSTSTVDWDRYVPIDADGNGEINISDISAIGAHLLQRIDGYKLQVSHDGGETWGDVQVVAFGESALPDGGGRRVFDHLITDAEYGASYQVVNESEGNGGKSSNMSWFRDPPPVPQNFVASDGTVADLVRCSWDEVADVDSYTVWRADQPDGEPAALGSTTLTFYDDLTAELNVTYDYYVIAVNNGGESGPSNSDSGFNDGAGDPGLSLASPPPIGDGSAGNPFEVYPGETYELVLIDPVDGDVSESPNTTYSSSDPAHVTFDSNIMTIGLGAASDFTVSAAYNGINSNVLNFHIPYDGGGLFIGPDDLTVEPWLSAVNISDPVPPDQLGTVDHPFVLHDETFNPDANLDGTYDLEFTLFAKDGDGNDIDEATLSWGCFPPFIALDIDDASKGTYHVNQFSVGYVFAQDITLQESNHLYVEVHLDGN